MSSDKNELPQVAASTAGNPPPDSGAEARILGASNHYSKGQSNQMDNVGKDDTREGIEHHITKLHIGSQPSGKDAKANNPAQGAKPGQPGEMHPRRSQGQRQRAWRMNLAAQRLGEGKSGTPKGEQKSPSTPATAKRGRPTASSSSSMGDSGKPRIQPRKKLATGKGAVPAVNRKGNKGTTSKPSQPEGQKRGAGSKNTYAQVASRASAVVFYCTTSPEGYSPEQSSLITVRLEEASREAQKAGICLKLEDPGGLRRMLRITPVDDLTRNWLKDYVDSGKLENVWNGAKFTLKGADELEKVHKASMFVPSSKNQDSDSILAQIRGTNPSLSVGDWCVHSNHHTERPIKGNLVHLSVPQSDKEILTRQKGILHLGLHKVEIRFGKPKRGNASPPRIPNAKRSK